MRSTTKQVITFMEPVSPFIDLRHVENGDASFNIWPDNQLPHLPYQSPALTFPAPLSPPVNLPVRLPAHTAALADLDLLYDRTLDPNLIQHPVGISFDETKSKDAVKILEQHIRDRLPYIQLASDRMQAVMGLRNESVFDLPEEAKRTNTPLRKLYSIDGTGIGRGGLDAGREAKAAARNCAGIGLIPRSPLGIRAIDKETGKGLREFLLQKGKEMGMKKRECRNISFHDFTPDLRTGAHRNVLLSHYGVGEGIGKGERVDVYEVDLPTMKIREDTGEEIHSTERWIWVLISRPVVSFGPNDLNTKISPASPVLSSPANETFPTPQHSHPGPPPNFPRPIPTSWLVFAAPLSHVTEYPETVENPDPKPTSSAPSYPFSNPERNRVSKRRDYDFSHSGLPIFEFSCCDLFTNSSSMTFLSVENIGPWNENDSFEEYDMNQYAEVLKSWENGEGRFDDERDSRGQMPCPNKGLWWEDFYTRMYEDHTRWEAVKRAMGKGRCRVVIRWVERVGGNDMNGGLDVGRREIGKRGLGLRGEKRDLVVGRHKRLTRSETRRRSALSLSEEPKRGSAVVSGLSESVRSRAACNKDLGRGAAGEKEKRKEPRPRKK